MNITTHAAASKVAEQWQSEGIAHRVDIQVRNELCQCLPPEEDGPDALSQQSEVREQVGLHKHTMPQKDKLRRAREHNVETTPCTFQDLLASHTQVSRVHHNVDVCVPVQMRGYEWVIVRSRWHFDDRLISNTNHVFFQVILKLPVLQSPDGTP